jgi:hypothetical protein
MKLDVYNMAPESISKAYFINPAHQSVCVCVSPMVGLQRLGELVPTQRIHTKIEELLGA